MLRPLPLRSSVRRAGTGKATFLSADSTPGTCARHCPGAAPPRHSSALTAHPQRHPGLLSNTMKLAVGRGKKKRGFSSQIALVCFFLTANFGGKSLKAQQAQGARSSPGAASSLLKDRASLRSQGNLEHYVTWQI